MAAVIRHAILAIRRRDGGLETMGAPVSIDDWQRVVNYVRMEGVPANMRVHDMIDRIRAGKHVSRQDCVSAVVHASARQHFEDTEGLIRTIMAYSGLKGTARTVRLYGYHQLIKCDDTAEMLRVAAEAEFLARHSEARPPISGVRHRMLNPDE